jgi:hypothetical protein
LGYILYLQSIEFFPQFVSFAQVVVSDIVTQLSTKPAASPNTLVCKHCKHTLGVVDDAADGWRLWKWTIHIPTTASEPANTESKSRSKDEDTSSPEKPGHSSYSTQKWISARLLYLIENTALRKFHIHPDIPASSTTPVPSLLVWVFTPDLYFSSSVVSPGRHDPTRAMKVFYKEQEWSPPKPGEPEMASVEEVAFPGELWDELRGALEGSEKLLPVNARVFRGWRGGRMMIVSCMEGKSTRDGRVIGDCSRQMIE